MSDGDRFPSSIPTPDAPLLAALPDALIEAANQDRAISSNAMLDILRAAEPKLYAHWAEGRLEAVTDAIGEAITDAIHYAHLLSTDKCPDADGLARAALGLGDRSS